MARDTDDSGGDRLERLARIRAQLAIGDGVVKSPPRHRQFGWAAWAGACVVVVAAFVGLAGLAPMRADASAKTQARFSLPAPLPLTQQKQQDAKALAGEHANSPMIALVIDDIGPARQWSQAALELPKPVAMAVLPYVSDATEWAIRAEAAGHEVILHMPMEPVGLEDPGPGALLRALSPAQNRKRLLTALDRVPGIIGVNNHMGSRFTTCARCVRQVADILRDRGLVFLDSVTSQASIAAGVVERVGVPVMRRDIFLDDVDDPHAIEVQMQKAEKLAHEKGVVVVIAHPRPASLVALRNWVQRLEDNGITLVSLRTALARQQALERGVPSRSAGL